MSYIDSYAHELVGLFGPLPVYHPLENIASDGLDMHFSCSTEQIVIGGGSGEHSGLVIVNPTAAVACFLDDQISTVIGQDLDSKYYPLVDVAELWEPIVSGYTELPEEILHFAGWGVQEYRDFFELCKSHNMPNPYYDDGDIYFEAWLTYGIGEFIFYALPNLASKLIGKLETPYQFFHHLHYNNILIYPPNMPVYANGGNAWDFSRRNISA